MLKVRAPRTKTTYHCYVSSVIGWYATNLSFCSGYSWGNMAERSHTYGHVVVLDVGDCGWVDGQDVVETCVCDARNVIVGGDGGCVVRVCARFSNHSVSVT